jgi:ABC-type Mn2+/Zn2+ transport system permease subunit
MNSVGIGLAIIMLVLSANNVGLDISDIVFGKLLIYKRKKHVGLLLDYSPCSG